MYRVMDRNTDMDRDTDVDRNTDMDRYTDREADGNIEWPRNEY
jgi:hypothetical protein